MIPILFPANGTFYDVQEYYLGKTMSTDEIVQKLKETKQQQEGGGKRKITKEKDLDPNEWGNWHRITQERGSRRTTTGRNNHREENNNDVNQNRNRASNARNRANEQSQNATRTATNFCNQLVGAGIVVASAEIGRRAGIDRSQAPILAPVGGAIIGAGIGMCARAGVTRGNRTISARNATIIAAVSLILSWIVVNWAFSEFTEGGGNQKSTTNPYIHDAMKILPEVEDILGTELFNEWKNIAIEHFKEKQIKTNNIIELQDYFFIVALTNYYFDLASGSTVIRNNNTKKFKNVKSVNYTNNGTMKFNRFNNLKINSVA